MQIIMQCRPVVVSLLVHVLHSLEEIHIVSYCGFREPYLNVPKLSHSPTSHLPKHCFSLSRLKNQIIPLTGSEDPLSPFLSVMVVDGNVAQTVTYAASYATPLWLTSQAPGCAAVCH